MEFKNKYIKYKNKYLILKKQNGGFLYVIDYIISDECKILLKKTDGSETYNNYKLSKCNIVNNKVNELELIYSNILNGIKIVIEITFENVPVSVRNNKIFVLLRNVKIIKNIRFITGTHNKSFSDIDINFDIIKKLLDFNKINENIKDIIDVCTLYTDLLDVVVLDNRFDKLSSILVHDEVKGYINNILQYDNLVLFIFWVVQKKFLAEHNEYTRYANKLFKRSLSINLFLKHVQLFPIKNKDGTYLKEMFDLNDNEYKIEIDTGNESYTGISNKFYNEILKHQYTEQINGLNICINGVCNNSSENNIYNIFVKFKIVIKNVEYTLISVVMESLDKLGIDILIGMKCGIDLFFINDFIIKEKFASDDFNNLENSKAYTKYIKGLDDIIFQVYENLKNISDEIVDEFMCKFIFLISEFNTDIGKNKSYMTLENIKERYFTINSKNVKIILGYFEENDDLKEPNNKDLSLNMSYEEYQNFMNEHFVTLQQMKEIIDETSKSKYVKNLKIYSFSELLHLLV